MRPLSPLAPWLGALAFAAGALVVVGWGSRRAEDAFPPASVFDESPHGLSLAFGYLRDRAARPEGRGSSVAVLSRRVGHERLPVDAVLFRVRPQRLPFAPSPEEAEEGDTEEGPADKGQAEEGNHGEGGAKGRGAKRSDNPQSRQPLLSPAEDDWVRGGGRLVLGVEGDYGPLHTAPSPPTLPVRKVFPIWPGVKSLVPGPPLHTLAGPTAEEAHAVFASGSAPVLSRLGLGKGDVVLLSLPGLLENAGLPRGDHLRLLVALAGEGRPVFFDEWALGLGRTEGLLDLLLAWGLGPAFIASALAFALWVWRARTRLGPEDADPAESRSEAVDLVDSLAQLYERALTRREAARLQYQGFHQAVAARTGLSGTALARRAQELLGREAPNPGEGAEIPPAEFRRSLHAVNQGLRRLYEHGHPRRRR